MYDSEYGNTIEGNSSVEVVISEFVEIFNFDAIFFPFSRFVVPFETTLIFDVVFFSSDRFIVTLNTGRGR